MADAEDAEDPEARTTVYASDSESAAEAYVAGWRGGDALGDDESIDVVVFDPSGHRQRYRVTASVSIDYSACEIEDA